MAPHTQTEKGTVRTQVRRLPPCPEPGPTGGFVKPLPAFPPRKYRTLLRIWALELAAFLLVASTFVAIVVLVSTQNGLPVPVQKVFISVNAYIAILSLAMKSCMMFVVGSGISQLKWSWFSTPRPLLDMNTLDEASRGVLGSAKLLWRLRQRNLLVYLGAVTTIALLVMDPFAQQLVYTQGCQRPFNGGSASIARTSMFYPSGVNGSTNDPVPLSLQAAASSAVYASDPSQLQLTPDCPSGQCDFGEFYTLGFCGSCDNRNIVNDGLNQSTVTEGMNISFPLQTISYEAGNASMNLQDGRNSTYRGFKNATLLYDSFAIVYDQWVGPNASDPNAVSTPGSPSGFFNITAHANFGADTSHFPTLAYTVLAGFLQGSVWKPPLYGGPNCPPGREDWACEGSGAAYCGLDPCLQRIKSSVTNGTLTENVEGEWPLRQPVTYLPLWVNRTCALDAGMNETYLDEHFDPNAPDRTGDDESPLARYTPRLSVDGHILNLMSAPDPSAETAYALVAKLTAAQQRCFYGYENLLNLYNLLAKNLSGAVASVVDKQNVISPDPFDGSSSALRRRHNIIADDPEWSDIEHHMLDSAENWDLQGVGIVYNDHQQSSQHVLQMFNGGQPSLQSMNQTFRQVGQSLTRHVRNSGVPGVLSEPVAGMQLEPQICYAISWWWLAYPVLLMAATFAFMIPVVALIIRDELGPVDDWKGSVLPLMVHGVGDADEEFRIAQDRIAPVDEIRQLAKRKHVALNRTATGWKFS